MHPNNNSQQNRIERAIQGRGSFFRPAVLMLENYTHSFRQFIQVF